MIFQWKEFNVSILLLLNSTFPNKEYVDQVDWTADYNGDALEDLRGQVSIQHENFTQILDSIVVRNPDTQFQFFKEHSLESINGKMTYRGAACPNSSGANREESAVAVKISFVFGIFGQTGFGIFGVGGNILAIIVLSSSKKLKSAFNQILISNLAVHTAYIISSVVTEVYKVTGGAAFEHFFSWFLYPLKPMLLHTTTFLTVLMARERFKAVSRPLEYRSQIMAEGEWRRAIIYLLASLSAAAMFVAPLVWETRVRGIARWEIKAWNKTHNFQEPAVYYVLEVTDFRIDQHYILWYKNLATFFVTLFIPLVLLAYWNTSTYRLMQRSCTTPRNYSRSSSAAALQGGPNGPTSAQTIKREEERKARILFVIILIFILCNTLRFILNFEECIARRDYYSALQYNCNVLPFWALAMNHCSSLLVCVNASFGFVVYCVMSREFRNELNDWWKLKC